MTDNRGGTDGEKVQGIWCREADAGPGTTSEDEIRTLVHSFYARIRADAELGPIFNGAIEDWDTHLAKMCDFWSSVMMTTGRYKGQPMRAHMKLKQVTPGHFDRWLMAESLQLGMFFKPAQADPERRTGCC